LICCGCSDFVTAALAAWTHAAVEAPPEDAEPVALDLAELDELLPQAAIPSRRPVTATAAKPLRCII
jgi:hypothetical protein